MPVRRPEPPKPRRVIAREEPPVTDLNRVLADLGAESSRVQLWRVRDDGKQAYIRQWSAQEFSLELVREQCGGGQFLARFFDSANVEQGTHEFIIDEPEEREATGEDITDIVRTVVQRETQQQPRESPFAIAAAMAAANAESMKAMFAVIGPLMMPRQDDTAKAVLTALLARERDTSPDAWLQMMEKAIEFVERKGDSGSSGGDVGYAQVLTQIGKPLVELLTRQSGTTVAPVAQSPQQLESGDVGMKPERNTPFAAFAPFMDELLKIAVEAKNNDEEIQMWAAAIETEQEKAVDLLYSIVKRIGMDKAVESFVKTFPAVDPQREFFRKLFEALTAESEGEE